MSVNATNQEKFGAYWAGRFGSSSGEGDDIRKMIAAAAREFGIVVTPLQAYTLWSERSEQWSAGWLVYSENEWLEILAGILGE